MFAQSIFVLESGKNMSLDDSWDQQKEIREITKYDN